MGSGGSGGYAGGRSFGLFGRAAQGGVVPDPKEQESKGNTLGSIIGYPGFPKPKKPLKHLALGGIIPGEARVGGDSTQNDFVPVELSPDEIVIPRSVAQRKEVLEFLSKYPEMRDAAPGFKSVAQALKAKKGRR